MVVAPVTSSLHGVGVGVIVGATVGVVVGGVGASVEVEVACMRERRAFAVNHASKVTFGFGR